MYKKFLEPYLKNHKTSAANHSHLSFLNNTALSLYLGPHILNHLCPLLAFTAFVFLGPTPSFFFFFLFFFSLVLYLFELTSRSNPRRPIFPTSVRWLSYTLRAIVAYGWSQLVSPLILKPPLH